MRGTSANTRRIAATMSSLSYSTTRLYGPALTRFLLRGSIAGARQHEDASILRAIFAQYGKTDHAAEYRNLLEYGKDNDPYMGSVT